MYNHSGPRVKPPPARAQCQGRAGFLLCGFAPMRGLGLVLRLRARRSTAYDRGGFRRCLQRYLQVLDARTVLGRALL
jgi:hypothetical protein